MAYPGISQIRLRVQYGNGAASVVLVAVAQSTNMSTLTHLSNNMTKIISRFFVEAVTTM